MITESLTSLGKGAGVPFLLSIIKVICGEHRPLLPTKVQPILHSCLV